MAATHLYLPPPQVMSHGLPHVGEWFSLEHVFMCRVRKLNSVFFYNLRQKNCALWAQWQKYM